MHWPSDKASGCNPDQSGLTPECMSNFIVDKYKTPVIVLGMHPKITLDLIPKLRDQGLTITEISIQLSIPKGTVAYHSCRHPQSVRGQKIVRDKTLTAQINNAASARKVYADKHRVMRQAFYMEGMDSPITLSDALFVGLYWGEGDKSKGQWGMCNSDPEVIRLAVQWAVRHGQPRDQFSAKIQVHPEDVMTDKLVQSFWSRCGITEDNIKVFRVRSSSSKRISSRRIPYGTCAVRSIKNGTRLYQYYLGQKHSLGG